ncbi:hypothetical protein Pfo_010147 [Paulownia fortunei]|nr:hypothetical protein Pfo_010147 [Paulownia fortunei]
MNYLLNCNASSFRLFPSCSVYESSCVHSWKDSKWKPLAINLGNMIDELFNEETPDREKEKVPSASPQCMSFNRSRSGRLLMPILEFWRNQGAIYNAD